MDEKIVIEREIAGRTLRLETGELAKQADGAVLVRYGDTVVLVTAVVANKPRENIDFFPLTVDYEERLYAAGKIPGGFIKREGRPSERGVLTCRLIDRPLRPLFPEGFRHDVQIIALSFSADQVNEPDIPALIGASAALSISKIPFNGPIAAIRIGMKDGEFIMNPTSKEILEGQMNLVVAGTKDNIMMVEAGAWEVSEDQVVEALALAHVQIKSIIEMIEELTEKAGKPKAEFPVYKSDKDLEVLIRGTLSDKVKKAMRIFEKGEREDALAELNRQALIAIIETEKVDDKERLLEMLQDTHNFDFDNIMKKIMEEELRVMVAGEKLRPDGRGLNEIRPLSATVGLLPRTHGSALFSRGQTQVMTITTLGTISEEQILDGLGIEESKRYIHQYNFPPFSVGEVKMMRGPGRRDIGHGALAERALIPMLPTEEEFPYTIRIVSEVLESNGSSSMASTCGSTLSLMDAGVPIKKPIAGIAMGLVLMGDKYSILTDIQGMEDSLGEMDFKVTGSRDGITALQMDIKVQGISLQIMKEALAQAKEARFKILDLIVSTIPEPRAELSPYAPRMIIMHIDPDKIREVIGPGGKVINKIVAETGVKIDIEDDGRIFIAAIDLEAGEMARRIIENLIKEVEVGEVYNGKVTRLMNFGAFVEIGHNKEGLVHISALAPGRVDRVEDVVQIGDEMTVKVMEIDSQGRINLSNINALDNPPPPPRRSGPGGRGGGGGFNRRPGGDRGGRRF